MQNILSNLELNAIKNSVFFVSNEVLSIPNLTPLQFNEFEKLKGKIFTIENDLNLEYYNENRGTAIIFGKNVNLQSNILILFEKREEFDQDHFNYVVTSYYNFINNIVYISNYLIQLSFNFTTGNKDVLIKDLELQNDILLNHRKEFISNFLPGKLDVYEIEKTLEIADSLNELVEEIVTLTELKVKDPAKSKFSDFIRHDERIFIVNTLVEKLTTEKGKYFRYLIEYFKDLKLLYINYGGQKKIYSALKNSFNRDIGNHSSIWSYKFQKDKNEDYLSFINRIESYFNRDFLKIK